MTTTTTTRAAGHVRSASKPTPARRMAIRLSIGTTCFSCHLTGSWSRADVAQDYALQMGHVIGEVIGGTYRPGNVGAQHKACNTAAKVAQAHDLSAIVAPGTVPAAWVPTKQAQQRGDVRDVPAADADDMPDADTMRAARRRRGIGH